MECIQKVNGVEDPDRCLYLDIDKYVYIDVRRRYFLKDAIKEAKKKKFDCKKIIKVTILCGSYNSYSYRL